jgi:DNA-binding NarL/FixJ family response regulator
MAIRVIVADDHAVMRDGLISILKAQPEIDVVGNTANGRDTISAAERLKPDVVIMDIAMPHLNGIDATLQLQQSMPGVKVIILSMHSTAEYIYRALKAGARGYLLKDSAGTELIRAIRAVHNGQRYLSQKISDTVISDYLKDRPADQGRSPLEQLSPREREILQLVVEGKTSAEISKILFLSPKTIETYRSRLMQKLDIKDIAALVKFAVQHGLTPLE